MASLGNWPLVIAILATVFAGKLLGRFLGGRLAGLPKLESWTLGCGLNGRGIMELVIANIALSNHFISQELFSILVLMGAVTTLVTPFWLRYASRNLDREHATPASTDTIVSGVESSYLRRLRRQTRNGPPVANLDRITATQDEILTFPASDLSANDIKTDGDGLTVTAVIATDDTPGTLQLTNGMITWSPR